MNMPENTTHTSPALHVTTTHFPIWPWSISIFIAIILSISGNSWSLCLLSTKLKNVSTTTRSFMQLTALSDLFFLICLLPAMISIYKQGWIFGKVFCAIKLVEGPATLLMSINGHLATALHRYSCLSLNQLRRESPVIRKASIVTICIASHVISFPFYFLNDDGSEDSIRCDVTSTSSLYLRIYSMVLKIIGGVIPVCAIVCCYLAIMIKSRKLANKVCPSVPPMNHWSRSAKVTKVCLYTTSAFLLTVFPFQICHILMVMYPDMTGIVAVTSLALTFYILYTCLQPVIFSLVWDAYRQQSKKVFDNIKKAGKRCFKI